jgi:ABC-2 type transport system permease protein
VLDEQNVPLPAPTTRQAGEYEFRDVLMVDYPYFIDLRAPGMARNHPVTAAIPQLTMAWASPLIVERRDDRRVIPLLWSSPKSWVSDSRNVMPSLGPDGLSSFRATSASGQAAQSGSRELGVVLQGRFDSFFANRPQPLPPASRDQATADTGITSLVLRSPESARIVLYASNDFMDDQMLNAQVTASGTQYLGPLELFGNTLDWALQDDQLLQIRSRANFNRTLPPMERQAQALIEYFNYGLAMLWLLLLAVVHWLRKRLRRRHYAAGLAP